MIGNDIVDLQHSRLDSNWQRTGWLDKLFAKEEIMLIRNADDFAIAESLIWQMWSMKEAAYKIWNRAALKSCFSPKSFACSLGEDNLHSGTVVFGQQRYATRSTVNDKFIHTIATTENNLAPARVYISTIEAAFGLPVNMAFYKDEYGLPIVLDKESGNVSSASKSHHGRFQALVHL